MAQFELDSLTEYSDEAIIDEMRRVAALSGNGPLSRAAFRKVGSKVDVSTIGRRFGGWKSALKIAGLSHLDAEMFPSPYREKLNNGRAMSDEELIAEMQRVSAALSSRDLTTRSFDLHSSTLSEVIRERFGSWKAALSAAGLAQSQLGRRYTDEHCFENLAAVWIHYGRPPQHDEMKISPSTVGPKAYILRWGTWRKSLKAFVDWSNSEGKSARPVGQNQEDPQNPSVGDPPRNEEDSRDVKPGLRFKVFMRDRFRCIACGRSPATYLNLELHADHIISVYDGGKTVYENLQTLCQDCNLGKGRISIR